MTGTMSDVSFAEAIIKLPHCGTERAAAAGYCVNASALYVSSRQNAFQPASGIEGRACLAEYEAVGYIPSDSSCDASVSRTVRNIRYMLNCVCIRCYKRRA